MIKVGFIGAGNMGSALAKAAVKSADTKVYLYDMYEDKAKTLADEIGAEFKSNEYIAELQQLESLGDGEGMYKT